MVPRKYSIETKRSLLYAVSFDDEGKLQLGQDAELRPTRGGGTGFEQDLLLFERVAGGETAIVPRVSVELKFGGVTTHDSIVYSEKARRIRSIYPFVRNSQKNAQTLGVVVNWGAEIKRLTGK